MASPVKMETDLERVGLFEEMGYVHGDIYTDFNPHRAFNEEANRGRQILSNCTKSKAGNQDGYFYKEFPRAFEGEAYMDPIRMHRMHRLQNAKGNISGAFKIPSPPKMQNGLGSYYGTFYEHEDKDKRAEYFSWGPGGQELERHKLAPPNVKTNPGKKGAGNCYPNITIGKYPEHFLEEEYKELLKKSAEPSSKYEADYGIQSKAFLAGLPKSEYFDANPFEETPGMPEVRRKPSKTPSAIEIHMRVFMPTNPAKKDGGMKAGCLSKFPEYTPDIPEEQPREPEQDIDGPFRPAHVRTVYPIRSIIDANVKKEMNVTNYLKTRGVVYCDK